MGAFTLKRFYAASGRGAARFDFQLAEMIRLFDTHKTTRRLIQSVLSVKIPISLYLRCNISLSVNRDNSIFQIIFEDKILREVQNVIEFSKVKESL